MSSMRNSLHRRNHKERSQLAHRSRLGFLEKHKDYVLRARDYHSKKDRITRLRQKAADRNKDEYYFSMNKQRTEGGVHVQDRGNASLPVDMVKVLKGQDENYIRTMRTAGLKKIEKIKEQLSALADLLRPGSLGGLDESDEDELDEEDLKILQDAGVIAGPSKSSARKKGGVPARRIVFAESAEEARQFAKSPKSGGSNRDAATVVVQEPIDLGWKQPVEPKKTKKSRLPEPPSHDEREALAVEQRQSASERRARLLKELSARLHRDQMLRYAERELEMQKLLMGKGGSMKLKGVEKVGENEGDSEDEEMGDSRRKSGPGPVAEKAYKPRVYKWRAERKR
ncbi:u3 small nucleolar RNA-associated protein 11 [Auriscalpium vulgare]|uniref:U3 small nucleolar RNA-associated protein 11 n=1 Tax=Auriscalpium vulgare TaxID=40419 RepID=A0ACB8R5D0_9AGAM|nr:u3 small nucleolar RNA-associated protein 11 [Auriscalpium vulgare]